MDVSTGAAALALAAGVAAGAYAVRASRRAKSSSRSLVEAEEALRVQRRSSEEERHVQDRILSSLQDGVLLLDRRGITVYANDALERLLGSRPSNTASLLPLALRDVVTGAHRGNGTVSALIEVGAPARWLRATAAQAEDDGSVLVVVRDVTEARRIDAVRRDFVANASHELKTPAASIQAAAETLRQVSDEDPAAVPRFAGQLEREAVRLSRIVADLLDLTRLESGSELDEHVRIDALAREEAERHREAAREAGLTLRVDAPAPAGVRGSGRDLSLLVGNLVDNAIRYTRPGGAVEITTTVEDGRVRLVVCDSGIGIPSRDLPRVFERFYRVDRARSRETGGTGLGLAIVKHVAENHGGIVRVESELGAGSTFTVEFPAFDGSA